MIYPKCQYDECDGEQHPDYVHAKSFIEISQALNANEDVRDQDGDKIVGIDIGVAGDATLATIHFIATSGVRSHYGVTTSTDPEDEGTSVEYVCVPIAMVSEDEVQAAIASILGQ